MGVAVLLAVLWQADALTVPLMGAIALIGGSLGTLTFPAFQGMLASMVPREDLESAVAINSLFLQVARFVGPAIAGVLLTQGGPTWVFAANAASFLVVLGAAALLPGSRATAGNAVTAVRGCHARCPRVRLRPTQPRHTDGADRPGRRVRHTSGRLHDSGPGCGRGAAVSRPASRVGRCSSSSAAVR